MLNKSVVKDIQSLGLKKHREESGLFIAEGAKVIEEFIQLKPSRIETIYAVEDWAAKTSIPSSITVVTVTEQELGKISQLVTPNKVLAVLHQFEESIPDDREFALYLDIIQDPGNFGTIIRIADWFGIRNVICSKGCADKYNPKVVQSTMASLGRVNIWYDANEDWLRNQKSLIYAATLNGRSVYEFGKADKGILLIGNESKGIRPEFLSLAKEQITIPGRGGAESLNAAVATGIILSHIHA